MSAVAPGQGIGAGGIQSGLRHAGKAGHIVDEQLKGVGRIEHVLRVLLGGLGELGLDLFQAPLLLRRQLGPVVLERGDRLFQTALAHAGEVASFLGLAEGFDQVPQVLVERDLRTEGTDLWQHRIVSFAQFRGIVHPVEMLHHRPGFIQEAGGLVQTEHHGVKAHAAAILVDDGIQPLLGLSQREFDVGHDALRLERGPADVEVLGQVGVGHGKRRNANDQ